MFKKEMDYFSDQYKFDPETISNLPDPIEPLESIENDFVSYQGGKIKINWVWVLLNLGKLVARVLFSLMLHRAKNDP